ncbi:MAG: hypothetical protein EZS28_007924 [Streblomastix strix]|uniref:Uncharacterized protein n=1 Tax=Streblomastix strix TaxID=222440 RepID=A0A5J4WNY3_9EUKA|nr:MAG: hypothetical protein EZS28_007924 [Streblomastix strix]
MEHPQELSLLVTQLETLFNILENQYVQLAGLPFQERNQTGALREKLKQQMKQIVSVLDALNSCSVTARQIITSISRELDLHIMPNTPSVLFSPSTGLPFTYAPK